MRLLGEICFGLVLATTLVGGDSSTTVKSALPGARALQAAESQAKSFLQLLKLSPEERAQELAKKSEKSRSIIERRLKEFDQLTSEQREIRLRLMELQWELLL